MSGRQRRARRPGARRPGQRRVPRSRPQPHGTAEPSGVAAVVAAAAAFIGVSRRAPGRFPARHARAAEMACGALLTAAGVVLVAGLRDTALGRLLPLPGHVTGPIWPASPRGGPAAH